MIYRTSEDDWALTRLIFVDKSHNDVLIIRNRLLDLEEGDFFQTVDDSPQSYDPKFPWKENVGSGIFKVKKKGHLVFTSRKGELTNSDYVLSIDYWLEDFKP